MPQTTHDEHKREEAGLLFPDHLQQNEDGLEKLGNL